MTEAAATTPKMSPICILLGVQPRIWPALRSCIISPATETETQVKAATIRTAEMPLVPFNPRSDHDEGHDDQDRDRQAAGRVGADADDADEIARNGGEDESQDQHQDDGHGRGRRALGKPVKDEEDDDGDQDDRRQGVFDVDVPVGPGQDRFLGASSAGQS